MRFGPEFDNLPDTVPKALYNVVDKKKDSMKKVREKLELKPTQEQQTLVRRFAQLMPPDFFFDSVIFPMDEKLARGLADMTESVGEVIGYPFTSDGYSCYFDGNQFSLLDKYARSLISGSIGDLYSYMKSYAPLAYNAIRNAAVRHEFPEFKITPESIKDVQNLLSEFRKQRSFNKTMDVVSKIKPIALIDQDSTISKFTITPDMPVHDKCLHVGSGSNTSSSIRAILGHYSRIVCVDPLTTPGPNHIKSTFDISKVKKNFDVVSDLAYGDGEGMIVGESIKHARELYTICHDRLVVVKLPAVIGYGQIFGHVLFKPRPHNLEVIVQLTPYGELLDEAFKPVIEKIIKANHERNICVFKNNLDMDIKPTFHTPLELRDLMLSRHQLPNPGNARNLMKIDRNKNMVVQGGYVKIGQRHKELKMRCTNPSYRFDGPYGQLPAYNIMRGKTFMELDPGLCDVDLSMRTVYRSAQSCGLSVVFVRGIWSVV